MERYKKYLKEVKVLKTEESIAKLVNGAYGTNIMPIEKRTVVVWETNEDLLNNRNVHDILKRFAQAYRVHPSQVTITRNKIILTKEER